MKSRVPTFLVGFCAPMAAIFLCFPLYNRIEPFILGISFNYFWIFAWLFLTSLCLYIGYRLDPFNDPEVEKVSKDLLEKAKAEEVKFQSEAKGNQTAAQGAAIKKAKNTEGGDR